MTRRVSVERDVLIVVCGISAGIHAALAPEHFREGLGAGLGFLLATGALAGLVVALTRTTGPSALALAALTLAGLLVAWTLAVTAGVPLLHPETEPPDGLAVATKAIEALGLVVAAHLLVRGRDADSARTERTPTWTHVRTARSHSD